MHAQRNARLKVAHGLGKVLASAGQVAQVGAGSSVARGGSLLVAVLGHVQICWHACRHA